MKIQQLQYYFIFFLLFIGLISCKENNDQLIIQESTIKELSAKNDSLIKENKFLLEKFDTFHSSYSWFDFNFDGEQFIENGIDNIEEFIMSELHNKTEIIPIKATLGGKMDFDRIQLLGKNWLIADYSDGHIYGKSLIEFYLNKSNELSFKIIANEID